MRPLALALFSGLLGCASPSEPAPDLQPPTGCDPVDPALCGLPFPSAYFQTEAQTPSGVQNAFTAQTLPPNADGVAFDPTAWNRLDGASTLSPLLTWIEDLSLEGTVSHLDPARYLDADARTVVVNTRTGERVPHFVELDLSYGEEAEKLLILRPLEPLEHATTYAVGLRGLVHLDGSLVAPTPAFAALRDQTPTDQADIENQRDRFETVIFPALSQTGVARSELQRAWSFTTVSAEGSLGDALHLRDDALARLDALGPDYLIDEVIDGDCATEPIARTIEGQVRVPRYTDSPTPPTRLVRDAEGRPVYQDSMMRPFLVRIPCSLALDPDPERRGLIVQYGHGMLGQRTEAMDDWLAELIDDSAWVLFAMDWSGMSRADTLATTLILGGDISDFPNLTERTQQGFIEKMVGLRMMQGPFLDDPAMRDFRALGGRDAPVGDPERVAFYGVSQGAILGGGYAALSPDLQRVALSVGATPFSLILSRSAAFQPFFTVLGKRYDDPRAITLAIAMLQLLWDPAESAGYAHFLGEDPLPGAPPKRVLHQVAIGDPAVSTLGAQLAARAWGQVTLAPAVRPIWGVEEVAGPVEGSALVEWLYTDGSEEPVTNLPPSTSGDTHTCPRREPAAQAQLRTFLETGVAQSFCDGPCISSREAAGCQ